MCAGVRSSAAELAYAGPHQIEQRRRVAGPVERHDLRSGGGFRDGGGQPKRVGQAAHVHKEDLRRMSADNAGEFVIRRVALEGPGDAHLVVLSDRRGQLFRQQAVR
jgi:hypothetical protein